jgi:hypothetical protein
VGTSRFVYVSDVSCVAWGVDSTAARRSFS